MTALKLEKYSIHPTSNFLFCFFTLLLLQLFTGCSKTQDNQSVQPPKYDWTGTPEEFRKTFDATSGQFVFIPENQTFSGLIRIEGSPSYVVTIRNGLPVKWVDADSNQPLLRWFQEGCWIGLDSAWEEDFQETANGLLHLPSNQLFTGKVYSINQTNGQILAEYPYERGISHGAEIYYDDNMEEESRVNWVNGVIPIRKL